MVDVCVLREHPCINDMALHFILCREQYDRLLQVVKQQSPRPLQPYPPTLTRLQPRRSMDESMMEDALGTDGRVGFG